MTANVISPSRTMAQVIRKSGRITLGSLACRCTIGRLIRALVTEVRTVAIPAIAGTTLPCLTRFPAAAVVLALLTSPPMALTIRNRNCRKISLSQGSDGPSRQQEQAKLKTRPRDTGEPSVTGVVLPLSCHRDNERQTAQPPGVMRPSGMAAARRALGAKNASNSRLRPKLPPLSAASLPRPYPVVGLAAHPC